ncbi:MAG: DUF2807 domain-containing protein [Dehalococcoidia bacterium]
MTRWIDRALWATWWPGRVFVSIFAGSVGITRSPGDQPNERRQHWMRVSGVLFSLLVVVVSASALYFAGRTDIEKGSGKFVVERRETLPFTRMVVTDDQLVIVTIEEGAQPLVVLTMDENLMPLIRSRVSEGTLVIDASERVNRTLGTVIRVYTDSLERILVSDHSIVKVRGVDSARFELDVRGRSDVEVDGVAGSVVILARSSRVEARFLLAGEARVDVRGDSTVDVYAGSAITGFASDDAEIRISGGATAAQISTRDNAVVCTSGNLPVGVVFSCRY